MPPKLYAELLEERARMKVKYCNSPTSFGLAESDFISMLGLQIHEMPCLCNREVTIGINVHVRHGRNFDDT